MSDPIDIANQVCDNYDVSRLGLEWSMCKQAAEKSADRIAQLEAALRDIDGCSAQAHVRHIARAALGEDRT